MASFHIYTHTYTRTPTQMETTPEHASQTLTLTRSRLDPGAKGPGFTGRYKGVFAQLKEQVANLSPGLWNPSLGSDTFFSPKVHKNMQKWQSAATHLNQILLSLLNGLSGPSCRGQYEKKQTTSFKPNPTPPAPGPTGEKRHSGTKCFCLAWTRRPGVC